MDIDINTLRSAATVLSLVLFIGIMVWAWSRKRQDEFAEAAQIPFEQDGS
jgi:cytochrome c oxidase cbb3-type subunit 4